MDARYKYAAWTVTLCVTVIAGACVAIFGDADDQAWITDRILPFVVGLLVPGSPLGALFKSGPS